MRLIIFSIYLFLTSCAVIVEHEDGKLPKIKVELPVDDCQMKLRANKALVECEKKF